MWMEWRDKATLSDKTGDTFLRTSDGRTDYELPLNILSQGSLSLRRVHKYFLYSES